MIQTEHLEKIYKNGFKAVSDLSLHVEAGDIFGFLGPNGAGKTTTIRMLDGLLEPTNGKVIINGIGTFFLKFDPMASCFNMMASMLTDRVSFFAQMQHIVPLILFALIGISFMVIASRRVALKGEK